MNIFFLRKLLSLLFILTVSFGQFCCKGKDHTSQPKPGAEGTKIEQPGSPSTVPGEPIKSDIFLTELLGKSVENRSIKAEIAGNGPENIIMLAVIHGDEGKGEDLINKYLGHLKDHPELVDRYTVWLIPVLNPDGLARGTRQNAHDIDLNRNFPAKNFSDKKTGRYYGGKIALSEPESKILHALVLKTNPARILLVHSPLNVINWDGPVGDLAKWMSQASGIPATASIGYSTPGSFGSWAGVDKQIPVITFELSASGWSSPDELKKLLDSLDVFVLNKPVSGQL